MKKKVLSVIIIFSLILGSFGTTFCTKAEANPIIKGKKIEADSEGEITIPIVIEGNTGIMGFTFYITYDEAFFEPKDVTSGEVIKGGMLNNDIDSSNTNVIKVCWASNSQVTEDGVLFYITFNVLENASGSSSINIESDINDTYNEEWTPVEIECQSIEIEIDNSESQDETVESTTTEQIEVSACIYGEGIFINENILTVPILIDNNAGIMGYKLDIQYDKKILQAISVDKNSQFSGFFLDNIGLKENEFSIIWTGTENTTYNGELVVITFKLLDANVYSTDIVLDYSVEDTFNEQYEDVMLDCKNITVIINEEASSEVETTVNVDENSTIVKEETTSEIISTKSDKNTNLDALKFKKTRVKIKRLKNIKTRKVKVSWKKVKAAKKYEIQYSSNKRFKKKTKTIVVRGNRTSKIVRKLKMKIYYFRIRAVKKVGNKVVYTKWSRRKKVRVRR